ncbi:MAG: hypothetical protein ACOC8O_00665 [Natronomonas sp.]
MPEFDGARLTSADTQDEGSAILHQSEGFNRGNTYEFDIEFLDVDAGADVGILFGSQQETVSWGSYSGYLAFFDTESDDIRLDRWSSGSLQDSESSSWNARNEAYRCRLDYGDTNGDDIVFNVHRLSDDQLVADVTLTSAFYDDGYVGFYRHNAGNNWEIDAIGLEGTLDDPAKEDHDVTMDVTIEDVTEGEDVEMILEFTSQDDYTYGLDILAEVGDESEWDSDASVTTSNTYTFTFSNLDAGTYEWLADVWVLDEDDNRITPDLIQEGTVTVGDPPEEETGDVYVSTDGTERAVTAIDTSNGAVEAGYINHGDGEGEQQFWPTTDTSSSVVVIDDFDDGTIASEWMYSEDYDTVADADATAGYAIYRTASTRLWMPDGAAERQPEQGGWFFVWTVNTGADGQARSPMQFIFGADGDIDDWPDRVECNLQLDDDGSLEIRHNGTTAEMEPLDGGWPSDEYVTCVAQWRRDATLHYWVYDDAGDEIGYLSAELDHPDEYGDWGLNPNSSMDNLRIGTVEMHDRHPETNHKHSDDPYADVSLGTTVLDAEEGDPVDVDVQLDAGGDTTYHTEIEVTVGSETQTEELVLETSYATTFTFDGLGAGTYDWEVTTRGASDSGTVTVEGSDSTPEETVSLLYTGHSSPEDVYNVNDHRGGDYYFSTTRSRDSDKSYVLEYGSNSKVNNSEYRFTENGYGYVDEFYFEIEIYPTLRLDDTDTVRFLWAPLTNGTGSSGSGHPDGTNGWSNAIGFSDRNESPSDQSPPGYKFFSYTYHMDKTTDSGDFEMTDEVVWMDQWNTIAGYVKVNTYDSGGANYDGIMRYWVNGELAYNRENFRMTTESDNEIEGTGPMAFVLSSGKNGDQHWYDNHRIWLGDDIPADVKGSME